MKDISLHILDIAQNSISAKASVIAINITDSINQNIYSVEIIDNGKGIPSEMMPTITDPWTTSRITRKVGLGIPLFKQNAELTGGHFSIESEVGIGTQLKATFIKDNIDCLPQGDIQGVLLMLVFSNTEIDFSYTFTTDKGEYTFDTNEIKQVLEGVSILQPEIKKYLKEMLAENIKELY